MLLNWFLLDLVGPWTNRSMAGVIVTIDMLNFSMVQYTMGQMQLSASRVTDYFQVWAVLLVTLQSSVKIGHPYNRSKQIPVLELMSSFWAGNLMHMQTLFLLRIPLWLIWALNAARIIFYFAFSDKADAINQESSRFVADYMRYEHELESPQISCDAADPSGKRFIMGPYKYLVLGEDQVLRDLQEGRAPAAQGQKNHGRGRKHQIRLDPKDHGVLITVEKIWNTCSSDSGLLSGHTADQLKDVCLSFALYKLLRRRFYDLPLHETRLPRQLQKMRRLVFRYILQDAEKAFRVVATELSFLQDLFYSKHATMFAAGFPVRNLVFSLSLVAATGYIAYPVRHIPERMDQADHNTITHWVFITRVIVVLIVGKELAEIYIYVFTQWTKVLLLCSYVKRSCLRNPVVESAMRLVLCFMTRGSWNEKIRRNNILISTRGMRIRRINFTLPLPSKFPTAIKLEAFTKERIFKSFKSLEDNTKEKLDFYLLNAFGEEDYEKLLWAVMLEADTHRILVWHIATCLCEIAFVDKPETIRPDKMWTRLTPFVPKPQGTDPNDPLPTTGDDEDAEWWEHYKTASSLSNYCSYLAARALVPDNGIIAAKVCSEVRQEINFVTLEGTIRSLFNKERSMVDVFECLMLTIEEDDEEDHDEEVSMDSEDWDINNSLTRKGAMLAKQLLCDYAKGKNRAHLWEKLATFWVEFLLHLSASTRASKHRTHLSGSRELTTHLWALLSHAGFLGSTTHGHALLDPEDLQGVNPLQ